MASWQKVLTSKTGGALQVVSTIGTFLAAANAAAARAAIAAVNLAGDTLTGNLRVNAAIGIGADPTEDLDVTAPAAATAVVRVRGNGEAATVQGMDLYANSTGHGIWGYGSRNVILGAGAAERVRIFATSAGMALVTSGTDQFLGGTGTNASIGMIAGSTFTAAASSGACFVMRGLTYSTNPNQRGNIYFIAGDPSAPGSTEGAIHFLTGATVTRAIIDRTGQVGVGTTSPSALLHVAGTAKVDTSLAIGGGTALTKAVVYTPNLTPANVAANTTAEEAFTVTGLATGDTVAVAVPGLAAGVGLVGARVSAADTLALTFGNFTAGALAPPAGVFRVIAWRS